MKQQPQQFPKHILFTHYGDNWIRGSERCLLDLMKHLDKSKYIPVLWCNQPIMAEQARELGIQVHFSDFPILFGWQKPKFNLFGFFKLIKTAGQLITQYNIDLIHANSAAPCQWLSFVAKQRNIPLLCHLHSTYQLRDRLTLGLYQTEMLVGVSEYVVTPFLEDNKPKQQITVINNGIDSERLLKQPIVNLRQYLNIGPGDFVIACLGSLIKRKGVDLLIDATHQLQQNGVPAHLLIIGDGPERNNLSKRAKQLKISDKVSFIGESNNAVGVLRGSADLFVSGAREEAFGLVFSEASLAGLAIVAPNIGGIPSVVTDQHTGLLYEKENLNALTQAIQQLYLSPTRCVSMAKAGKQHVLTNFTIEKNCQRFEKLYQQQLNSAKTDTGWANRVTTFYQWLSSINCALKKRTERIRNQEVTYEK